MIEESAKFCDGLGVLFTLVVSGKNSDDKPVVSDLVATAHANGLQVHVWTFRTDALPDFADNSEQLLEWLTIDAGVDGIFADQPDFVIQWRSQRMAQLKNGNPFRLLNNRPKN